VHEFFFKPRLAFHVAQVTAKAIRGLRTTLMSDSRLTISTARGGNADQARHMPAQLTAEEAAAAGKAQ
jgi:hypothetical protein